MNCFFETLYETVGMLILWQTTRFVTIRLAAGESHVIMR